MKEFSCLCNDVEQNLGRRLSESELDFLDWMYTCHLKEIEGKK